MGRLFLRLVVIAPAVAFFISAKLHNRVAEDMPVYLLYLDESGDPDNSTDRHFVLGGIAVFERQTFFLSSEFDAVQSRHFPGTPPMVFHAHPIRTGRDRWRSVSREARELLLQDIAKTISQAHEQGIALFSVVIEKTEELHGETAVHRATEELCSRFDIFLKQMYQSGNPQRGLVVFAEGRYHQKARAWVQRFRDIGTRWGLLRNLSDIPYFASPNDTRLLQAADFVAYAIYRLYERRDFTLAKPILQRFDQQGGILHGLKHVTSSPDPCDCPACFSRHSPRSFGPWI